MSGHVKPYFGVVVETSTASSHCTSHSCDARWAGANDTMTTSRLREDSRLSWVPLRILGSLRWKRIWRSLGPLRLGVTSDRSFFNAALQALMKNGYLTCSGPPIVQLAKPHVFEQSFAHAKSRKCSLLGQVLSEIGIIGHTKDSCYTILQQLGGFAPVGFALTAAEEILEQVVHPRTDRVFARRFRATL